MILRFAICLLALLVLLVLDMPRHCLLVIEAALLVEAALVVGRLIREQRASRGERGGRASLPIVGAAFVVAVALSPRAPGPVEKQRDHGEDWREALREHGHKVKLEFCR